MKIAYIVLLLTGIFCSFLFAQPELYRDTVKTSKGDLELAFVEHGTLFFTFNDLVIHIDPVGRYADYSTMPDAELILITHHHGDHLDPDAIGKISTDSTRIICSASCAQKLDECTVMKNGDETEALGITIKAVPAYNRVHKRQSGEPYHPKGAGNGYVLSFGDTKVYVAGDTENIEEMNDLNGIDIAFLPMNLPYTMSPGMFVDAVKMIKPKVVYPYHTGNSDVLEMLKLMQGYDKSEIRVGHLDIDSEAIKENE
ncbi:MBL fold metallo-hydrolase [candidate division KSB1 bacterium]|nr:MBL fold metallo-hydrolase [candidate division KSB1 bacterium]